MLYEIVGKNNSGKTSILNKLSKKFNVNIFKVKDVKTAIEEYIKYPDKNNIIHNLQNKIYQTKIKYLQVLEEEKICKQNILGYNIQQIKSMIIQVKRLLDIMKEELNSFNPKIKDLQQKYNDIILKQNQIEKQITKIKTTINDYLEAEKELKQLENKLKKLKDKRQISSKTILNKRNNIFKQLQNIEQQIKLKQILNELNNNCPVLNIPCNKLKEININIDLNYYTKLKQEYETLDLQYKQSYNLEKEISKLTYQIKKFKLILTEYDIVKLNDKLKKLQQNLDELKKQSNNKLNELKYQIEFYSQQQQKYLQKQEYFKSLVSNYVYLLKQIKKIKQIKQTKFNILNKLKILVKTLDVFLEVVRKYETDMFNEVKFYLKELFNVNLNFNLYTINDLELYCICGEQYKTNVCNICGRVRKQAYKREIKNIYGKAEKKLISLTVYVLLNNILLIDDLDEGFDDEHKQILINGLIKAWKYGLFDKCYYSCLKSLLRFLHK